MDETLDSNLLGGLEKNVGSVNVGVSESVRVTEGQINVGLGSEMEDGVNVVTLQAVHNLRWVGDIAVVKGEVSLIVQRTSVVERSAVVELIEGDDVVGIWVLESQVADQPTGAVNCVSCYARNCSAGRSCQMSLT